MIVMYVPKGSGKRLANRNVRVVTRKNLRNDEKPNKIKDLQCFFVFLFEVNIRYERGKNLLKKDVFKA